MPNFPAFLQLDSKDCGPTCLMMISKYYGKTLSLQTLREKSYITKEGVSMSGISDGAEAIGFRTLGAVLEYRQLKELQPFPCIVHWNASHFVVVYQIKRGKVVIADPGYGLITLKEADFIKGWMPTARAGSFNVIQQEQEFQELVNEVAVGTGSYINETPSSSEHIDTENYQISDSYFLAGGPNNPDKARGFALLLEPTPAFYAMQDEVKQVGFSYLFSYLNRYKSFIWQLFLGMLCGTIIQLIIPFLSQALVDIGINQRNIPFIYIVFFAQLVLFVSRTGIDILRSWILLHISARINISLIADFLMKLMKLPVIFFDSKTTGDILQRVNDHRRIEGFLTATTLNTMFSMLNLLVFGAILIYYQVSIFIVFSIGSLLYGIWIWFFMKKRKELDYKSFTFMAGNQSILIQLVQGIQEIKLQNAEKIKRWEWEAIQAKIFKLGIRSLYLDQYQSNGAALLNELKNLVISLMAAKSVVDGEMTLGMMVAIQYIIGQLNGPISQFISFTQSAQDASLSLERLKEVQDMKEEEDASVEKLQIFPVDKTIHFKNVTFSYEGPSAPLVLDHVSFVIPAGKVTAIVGASGSGKTTLLKLLLRFYNPTKGEILLGNTNINNFHVGAWREKCGAVLQDGYIFSDTILRNIAVVSDRPNIAKLEHAVRTANIHEFIDTLPLGFQTKIGPEGTGLSQGQKQRILIARSVYKNPEYLFFDEATNALDANNEKKIMENLDIFFQGRTVVVVAHRLSTVQKADQIIVLNEGKITEIGNHQELCRKKGTYYQLVKNQLELGN